jgi:sirohydrochlorin ferrochelatase
MPSHLRSANAPLVLAAHGSSDPRFGEVLVSLAAMIVGLRPALEVRIGFLEHGPPALADVSGPDCVVVPVLLTNGYHAHIDIPTKAAGVIAAPLGPDRRLATVLAERLRAAGWRGEQPIVLAAAGSADAEARADARQAAADLGRELGLPVETAFIAAGQPGLRDVPAAAIATYLIAPGRFADVVAESCVPVVAAPLGADRRLAEIALDRYDDALARHWSSATTPRRAVSRPEPQVTPAFRGSPAH